MRLSANTGFLFQDLPFLDRIGAARAAGFDAVEFHDEAQMTDPADLQAVLQQAGLPVIGLNVRMGATVGCAAIPGEDQRALQDFSDALRVADATGAGAIHVLAGKTSDPAADQVFVSNLARFADMTDRTILIEPICNAAIPGYFLSSIDHAARIIDTVGRRNLRIMFDCFHIRGAGDDIATTFERFAPLIGHIQIASYPQRAMPDRTDPDYGTLLRLFQASGHDTFGCEFRPGGDTVDADHLRSLID